MEDLVAEDFVKPVELELAMFFFLAAKLLIEEIAKEVGSRSQRQSQLFRSTDPFRRSREEAAQQC